MKKSELRAIIIECYEELDEEVKVKQDFRTKSAIKDIRSAMKLLDTKSKEHKQLSDVIQSLERG